jgi:polar amino acid transport system substrate-binding protein
MVRIACLTFLLLVATAFPLPSQTLNEETATVAFSEFPPYKMVVGDRYAGIDTDLLREVAKQLGLKLAFRHGTFEECLEMMRQGKADVMTTLLRRPEREEYILFAQLRYRTREVKSFYTLKDSGVHVREYSDLTGLKIGVKQGARYFPRFDNDDELTKVQANNTEGNLRRLLNREIDVFIDTRNEARYWLKTLDLADEIRESEYTYELLDPVYMGISRKSPLVTRVKKFEHALTKAVDKGVLERIKGKYLE